MRLLAALRREPLDRPPVWLMRQAGRYLPEYRELRRRHPFEEAMRTPRLAAEITLQPLRRFPLDAAIVFADIMTPLQGMGVPVEYDPGPRLKPLSIDEVARLPELDPEQIGFVAGTVAAVRASLDPEVAVIGFAGGPVTALAYLLDGEATAHFTGLRAALHRGTAGAALAVLGGATRAYLEAQVKAGADVVALFDTWAGLLTPYQFEAWAVPAAREALAGLAVPTIYFAPGAAHLLDRFPQVGATGYGVDWRLPLGEAWRRVGEHLPLQGNLDPAALLAPPHVVRDATRRVLAEAAGRPGHVFNLGHGVLPDTPLESVAAMVDTVLAGEPVGAAAPGGEGDRR
jgi:uroporphyrinogen decarboxylase